MNSKKIEMGAVLSIKQVIFKHPLMEDYINNNDKEPSWDGFIYLYKSEELKAEDIIRIPVQIKGKNDESILKRKSINYSVEYKHLRNYYNDGGIMYLVVAISDNGENTAIFYNALSTIKLHDMLKGTESKRPDQTKSIALRRLETNYGDNLFKLLSQLGMDRKKQGVGDGEIIKKSISVEDMNKLDCLKATSYLSSNKIDLFKGIATGEITLYGHREDIDMWLPFNYSHQREIHFKHIIQMNKPVGIDGINYYDYYLVEGLVAENKKPIIRLSENLAIDFLGGLIKLDMIGPLETLIKDVRFINKLEKGAQIFVNNKKLIGVTDVNISKEMQDKIQLVIELEKAFNEIGVHFDKRFESFSKENWQQINELLNLYHRQIKPKDNKDCAWYIWTWDDVIVPLMINVNENGELDIINWFTTKKYVLFVSKEIPYSLPNFVLFKRDILEKLYEVPRQIWIAEIERIKYSEENMSEVLWFFVEILSAYDKTQNETYFTVAELLINKILEVCPNNEYVIINKLQLQKRKGILTESQIDELELMEKKTENSLTKCAINILLDNKRVAHKLISELPEEKRAEMMRYPIYNLL